MWAVLPYNSSCLSIQLQVQRQLICLAGRTACLGWVFQVVWHFMRYVHVDPSVSLAEA